MKCDKSIEIPFVSALFHHRAQRSQSTLVFTLNLATRLRVGALHLSWYPLIIEIDF
jgi:hypothetical protein